MTSKYYDFLIIGGGPAGLQAAMLLQQKGANYCILEKTAGIGAHWRKYPRHRGLISINKKHTGSDNDDFNLRHDWNSLLTTNPRQAPFTQYSDELYPSADDLIRYLGDVFNNHELEAQFNCDVTRISKSESGLFEVMSSMGKYSCRYLFIGMGGKPWYPLIKGLDLPGIDTYENVSLDKKQFTNKKVLILGKGNSAFECGEYLSNTASIIHFVSPRQIEFAWNTHYVGDLRAVRNNLLDMYQLKSQHAIINGTIEEIELAKADDGKYKVTFSFSLTPQDPNTVIYYDRIIACTGFKYIDLTLFDLQSVPVIIDERPSLKGKFPKIDANWQFSGVTNLYAIGASMQTVNFRKNAGGFIHGFRYSIRTMIELIFHQEYDHPLPSRLLESTAECVTEELRRRMNTSSSLYQMYNELCDIVVFSRDCNDDECIYYYDLPMVVAKQMFKGNRMIVFTFNFGTRNGEDAFKHVLQATPENPEKSVFLHPVLWALDENGEIVEELHLLENLDTTWNDPLLHIRPLQQFIYRTYPRRLKAESNMLATATQ